jgi:hypothetical protein
MRDHGTNGDTYLTQVERIEEPRDFAGRRKASGGQKNGDARRAVSQGRIEDLLRPSAARRGLRRPAMSADEGGCRPGRDFDAVRLDGDFNQAPLTDLKVQLPVNSSPKARADEAAGGSGSDCWFFNLKGHFDQQRIWLSTSRSPNRGRWRNRRHHNRR